MRYKFLNHRPGISFHTPVGNVRTNEDDGAAELTPEQLQYFKKTGMKLEPIGEAPKPKKESKPIDARAQQTIAANAAAAAKIEAETQQLPLPKKR